MIIERFILALGLLLCLSCSASSWPDKYDYQIIKATKQFMPGVDWRLYKAQLAQESALRPDAVSPAGAKGIAQFMPATWQEVSDQLSLAGTPFEPHLAIPAGAYYMSKLRSGWNWQRPEQDKYNLALASYNAGFGNLLKAQKRCNNAILYVDIIDCLPDITKHHANETINYVISIRRYHLIIKANE
ncbi:MAG: soluble lytic murein transglycosylase-like protein [Pseudoalteromonas distincta]|jgi:soluble lytic murein transglycosylase-like protein